MRSQAEKFEVQSLVSAGRVVCPATGFDGPGGVAITGGRIVGVGRALDVAARQTFHFPQGTLLPGLIDLHTHPANSGSQWGIDPDQHLLPHGTTTALSQGDAGADNCEAYLRETIQTSRTRVRLAINLSRRGEAGPGGCFAELSLADVPACIAAIDRFREHIWGIAVNVSHHACGQTDPHEILRRGLLVAEQTGLPLLFGMRRPEDWPLADQLAQLRAGDVVTYCYRRTPHCIVEDGRVLPAVKSARERGVLFDVGHGTNSFDADVAQAAIDDGFPPDTISTDWQRAHLDHPEYGLPLVMSKLQAAGMPEADLFRAVTVRPAQILGLQDETGMLQLGACADLVVLERDSDHWRVVTTIRAGNLASRSKSV